ncbi:hypothetical protein IAD21_01708 [Abditibacteriota bacterium]|nr:hypothetical protein IAD21_01708 [Abditibacteriota bacterium]
MSESENLSISPPPTFQEEHPDRFGNRVLHLRHRHIEREFALSLDLQAPTQSSLRTLERGTIGDWKLPSRAVAFSPELLALAREYRALSPPERAEKLNNLVFDSLEYTTDVKPHPLNATSIWTQKRGSCADFAHVLLALGRAAGLPSRYIAGFGPSPGALHAWVEFGFEGHWHAFDPTHGRRAEGLYLPVAQGRDFYDCAPHQGSFRGGNARLEMHCELT